MTYEEIVRAVREIFLPHDVSQMKDHLAIQVNIVGEGEGAFYIELKDGELHIEPYEYYDRDLILSATAENFLKICNGTLDAILAYTTGKLKIEGDLQKALRLQDIIKSVKKENKAQKKKTK